MSQQYSIPWFWVTIGTIAAIAAVLGVGLYAVYGGGFKTQSSSKHTMPQERIPRDICKCQDAINKMKELYEYIMYASDLSDLPEPDYYYYMVIQIANALKSCNIDAQFRGVLARKSTNVGRMADFIYDILTMCGVSVPEE